MAEATHKGVSHTMRLTLLGRLERVAFRTKISRSAILEHAVETLFASEGHDIDRELTSCWSQPPATPL